MYDFVLKTLSLKLLLVNSLQQRCDIYDGPRNKVCQHMSPGKI